MPHLKDARRLQSILIERATKIWGSSKHRSRKGGVFIPEAEVWSVNGWGIRTWLMQNGVVHRREGYSQEQNDFSVILDCYYKSFGNPKVWTVSDHGKRSDVLARALWTEQGIDEAIELIQTHILNYSVE